MSVKECFVEYMHNQVQEYVEEAEHQEGEKYWDEFKSIFDIVKDFKLYLESDRINTRHEVMLTHRELEYTQLMLLNHLNLMNEALKDTTEAYRKEYRRTLQYNEHNAEELTWALEDMSEVLKDIETCEYLSDKISTLLQN